MGPKVCSGRSSIQPHPASERTRPGSDSISPRKAFTGHLLFDSTACPPHIGAPPRLSRIELRTVWRLYYRRHSHTLHQLAPVTTRSIPHQRSHIRLMLQPIDRRRCPLRLHRSRSTTTSPYDRLPPGTGTSTRLHSLTHLDPATTPYPTHHAGPLASHRQTPRPSLMSLPLRQGRDQAGLCAKTSAFS